MNRFFLLPISAHEFLNISESRILKYIRNIYSYPPQLCTGCNDYVWNVGIKFLLFEYVFSISLLIQILNFRNILIILINDSVSNCCIYKKRKQTHKQKRQSCMQSKHTFEYFSVRKRIIFILCFLCMLSYRESKSTIIYVLLSMELMSTSNFECWVGVSQ